MGAVEPYVSAFFARFLGPTPTVVAMAPWLFFAILAGFQFLAWNRWRDARTGHLAALLTIVGSPFLTAWGLVPRGGYVELLAWMMPTILAYRIVTSRDDRPLGFAAQVGWGALLVLGSFLNPLAWITYGTLLIDWTFSRHGSDLRASWGVGDRRSFWLDRSWTPTAWLGLGAALLGLLAACAHVDFSPSQTDTGPIVYGMGIIPKPLATFLALGLLAAVGWLTGVIPRVWSLLPRSPGFAIGAMLAQTPMLIYQIRASLGWSEREPSLPTWIRAPWAADCCPLSFGWTVDLVIGSRPLASFSPMFGQAVTLPEPAWPAIADSLDGMTPVVTAVVVALLGTVIIRDRHAWRRFWSLRGRKPSRPTILLSLLVGLAFVLQRIQGSSFDDSSVRYLLPIWAALPGLLAVGLWRWPGWARWCGLGFLLGCWGLAQANLWADAGRESPQRPLVRALEARGITGIVAQTPAALLVTDLSEGRVGALAYQPDWQRLGRRYANRVPESGPVYCVVDMNFPWPTPQHPGWPANQDLGRRLEELNRIHPGRLTLLERVGSYGIWQADYPLEEILKPPSGLSDRSRSGDVPASGPDDAGMVGGVSNRDGRLQLRMPADQVAHGGLLHVADFENQYPAWFEEWYRLRDQSIDDAEAVGSPIER